MKLESKFFIPLLLLICALIFFTNLDIIYINIMEARNFITAREMLLYDNWIHTTMNLEPRYEKPPLPTWLTAITGSIFGLKSLFGLRLPAAISATFLVLTSYYFSLKLPLSKKQSLIAALVLSTSFFIIFSGRNGQWDIFSHAFMLFAIYKLFSAFRSKSSNYKDWALVGVFFGLSFMSKGPVSFFALLLPFIIAFGLTYKFKSFRKKWAALVMSLLLFALVGLTWGLYIYFTDTGAAETIANKETQAWSNRNIRPFYYYWSFFTQSGMWTFFSFIALLYPYMIKRVEDKKIYKFTFLWTISAVILLSFIPEKKSRYLLPVLIPMAINTSFYIHFLIKKGRDLLRPDLYLANFGFGLLGLICLSFPFIAAFYFKDQLEGLWISFGLTAIILFLVGLYIFLFLYRKKYDRVFFASIAMICTIMVFGLPMAKAFYTNTDFNNISELRKIKTVTELPLFGIDEITPELLWELGEPVKMVKDLEHLPKQNPFAILITEEPPLNLSTQFDLKPVDTFDINYIGSTKSGYKKRLTTKLFIALKKSD